MVRKLRAQSGILGLISDIILVVGFDFVLSRLPEATWVGWPWLSEWANGSDQKHKKKNRS